MHRNRNPEPAWIQHVPAARFGYRRNRAGLQVSTESDRFWSTDHWAVKWLRDGRSWRNGDENQDSWRSFRPDDVPRPWWSGIEAYLSGDERTDEMGSPSFQRQARVNVYVYIPVPASAGSRLGQQVGSRTQWTPATFRVSMVGELIKSFWIM